LTSRINGIHDQGLLRGLRRPLLQALERTLVDAVNEVGVDINMAVKYDHMTGMLAFIGGLGLRKADALKNNIRDPKQQLQQQTRLPP
jgi:transcription elongation factor SPT6